MEKIIFFDTSNNGHHYLYNKAVMQGEMEYSNKLKIYYIAPDIKNNQKDELESIGISVVDLDNKSKFSKIQNFLYFFSMINFARKNQIKNIHLLYLDSLFLVLGFCPFLFKFNITSTLHWFPNRTVKLKILRTLMNMEIIKKIVVHGKYTKEKILKLFNDQSIEKKIHTIIYPNLHNSNLDKIVFNSISNDLLNYSRPFLLAFGGLRYDKGIDILLKSLSLVREEFTLIIAGKEDYFTKEDLLKLIEEYGLEEKVFLDIKFISDQELAVYFELTDIIVLPYRKYFSGQSGPLTEGVTRSKLIIGPENGEVGFTISSYNLGSTFEVENPDDLAKKISRILTDLDTLKNNYLPYLDSYKNLLTLESFNKSYNEVFKTEKN